MNHPSNVWTSVLPPTFTTKRHAYGITIYIYIVNKLPRVFYLCQVFRVLKVKSWSFSLESKIFVKRNIWETCMQLEPATQQVATSGSLCLAGLKLTDKKHQFVKVEMILVKNWLLVRKMMNSCCLSCLPQVTVGKMDCAPHF